MNSIGSCSISALIRLVEATTLTIQRWSITGIACKSSFPLFFFLPSSAEHKTTPRMPAGERFALPKDFDKSTASYASFAVKLKVLGGASAPYKQIGKSRPRGYNSFPAWKGRFSVALHGWVSEQARDLDEAVREDREVILWSVMGIQIQKIVTTMHAELEKQRKGEEDARVWSLVDLFLHFSEVLHSPSSSDFYAVLIK